MIIDWFSDFFDDPPVIYERTRGADGVLHERYIMVGDDDYVKPSCWVAENAPKWIMSRLKAYNATVHPEIKAKGIDGKTILKVTVDHPNTLWQIKDKCPKWTYEADLNYLDQILLTNGLIGMGVTNFVFILMKIGCMMGSLIISMSVILIS